MIFRNAFAIALAVSWVILAASATQKLDDNEGEQKSYSSRSQDPTLSSDSESFINSNSRGSLNSKSKSTVGSTFSENRRKTRGAAAPGSKVMPASESVIIDESRQRKTRSVDDDNASVETIPLPLENSTRSDSDNADITQEQADEDNSQSAVKNPETMTRDNGNTTLHAAEDNATPEMPTEAPATEAAVPSSDDSNDAEQTTITSDSHSAVPSTSEENHSGIEVDSEEATTANAAEVENFENENEDATTLMSLAEVDNDGDIHQSTENPENSESSTTDDLSDVELPATENSAVEEMTELITEGGFDLNSIEDGDATEAVTEIPTDYTTDLVETTTENNSSSETTISSPTTTRESIEKPKKNYNYFVLDDKSNIPCILANMTISLKVSYTTKHNRIVTSEFPVPEGVNASGVCGKKQSDLTLSWLSFSEDFEISGENRITFQLVHDGAFFYVSSVKVNITLDSEDYSNAAEATLAGNSTTDLRLFSASLKNGFHVCSSTTEIPCGPIMVQIKDVSLIAYNDRKDFADREQQVCQSSKTVSIAAVLGGLVAIAVTIGIVGSYIGYRKRVSTFRSELP